MADFVAVIRKAVDNLPVNTPENRAKVYDKARAAIRRQLEAINPPPSDEVIARQLDKLGQAIDEVESEHAEALPADQDETDALMSELESMVEKSPVITEPKPQPRPEPKPEPRPEPKPETKVEPKAEPRFEPKADQRPEPVADYRLAATPAPVPAPAVPVRQEPPVYSEPEPFDYDEYDDEPAQSEPVHEPYVERDARPADLVGEAHDAAFGLDHARERQTARPVHQAPDAKSGRGGLLAGILVALFVIVVAAAGWFYKDTVVAMFGSSTTDAPVGSDVANGDATPAEDASGTAPEAAGTAPEETAPEETAPVETALNQPEATPGDDGKFTQRLNPDGTETDAGPAEGADTGTAVEGRSVAALTDAGPADESAAEEATADAPVAPEDAAAPASQALGVQQKMILYEERLGQQSLEVKPGSVVWTLVSEPSGDGPDEQVIRGEINNPEKGLSALLTIKRNTDPSLPASHLVEIVFALPADFDGGSIDQLQRIAMKQTEADQGTPLIAVPAKITQDFYMVALNDLEEARRENTELLRNRSWIDIPVVYSNGRQALITLEKGSSGTEVFNQALDAWARAGG